MAGEMQLDRNPNYRHLMIHAFMSQAPKTKGGKGSIQPEFPPSCPPSLSLSGHFRGHLLRTLVPAQPGDPDPHVSERSKAQGDHDQDGPPPPLLQHQRRVRGQPEVSMRLRFSAPWLQFQAIYGFLRQLSERLRAKSPALGFSIHSAV